MMKFNLKNDEATKDLGKIIADEISNIKRGVIWNLTINSGNFESSINQILETHILYNPLTYECYEIS